MGPTNIALVKLYRAEMKLREALERLDSTSRSVRLQERRVNELSETLKAGQTRLRESQSRAGQLDLDLKSRDAFIERLRTQQQQAKNDKEYKTFLTEISTQKVERGKIEDETLVLMEQVEKAQAEVKELLASLEVEKTRLEEMRRQSGDKVAAAQGRIDELTPVRDQAAAGLAPAALDMFRRLADRFDGEAMSALEKPDHRHEEYVCGGCQMSLVVDVYNRLHSRDELVFCPSCRRMLFIPDELPPETAINARPVPKPKKERKPRAPKKAPAAAASSSASAAIASPLVQAATGDSAPVASGESPDPASEEANVSTDNASADNASDAHTASAPVASGESLDPASEEANNSAEEGSQAPVASAPSNPS